MKRGLLLVVFIVATLLAFKAPVAVASDDCGYAPSKLVPGGWGVITYQKSSINLRAEPRVSADKLGVLNYGDVVDVLAGSACADGYRWVHLRNLGLEGWAVETNGAEYFVEPYGSQPEPAAVVPTADPTQRPQMVVVPQAAPTTAPAVSPTSTLVPDGDCGFPPSPLKAGYWAHVSTASRISIPLKEEPSLSAKSIKELYNGTIFTVLEGVECRDGWRWLQVRTHRSGDEGWIQETDGTVTVLKLTAKHTGTQSVSPYGQHSKLEGAATEVEDQCFPGFSCPNSESDWAQLGLVGLLLSIGLSFLYLPLTSSPPKTQKEWLDGLLVGVTAALYPVVGLLTLVVAIHTGWFICFPGGMLVVVALVAAIISVACWLVVFGLLGIVGSVLGLDGYGWMTALVALGLAIAIILLWEVALVIVILIVILILVLSGSGGEEIVAIIFTKK